MMAIGSMAICFVNIIHKGSSVVFQTIRTAALYFWMWINSKCIYIPLGVAGMDSAKACNAMLDGIASAIRDLKPNSLSLIRIVILQQPVFQAFKLVKNLVQQQKQENKKLSGLQTLPI